MRKDLIRRSVAFQDPLVGGSLSRELGRGQYQDAVVRAFSQGLEGREILRSEEDMPTGRGIPTQTSSTVYIRDFDYDTVIGSLFFRMCSPLRSDCARWTECHSGQERISLLDNRGVFPWPRSFCRAFSFPQAKRKDYLATSRRYILNQYQST
jgi:hypothetical protein